MHREARCQCQAVLRDPSVTAAHCDTVLGEKRGTVSLGGKRCTVTLWVRTSERGTVSLQGEARRGASN